MGTPVLWLLPFAALLLSIAILPLVVLGYAACAAAVLLPLLLLLTLIFFRG